MVGDFNNKSRRGIIPRAINYIFMKWMKSLNKKELTQVDRSYYEIRIYYINNNRAGILYYV